jgi:hypothetical protein
MNGPEPSSMPRSMPRSVRWAASALAGFAVAVILHYMLYRIGIPLKPFIYVMF